MYTGIDTLRLDPYQREGAAFLAERVYACLFDEMGVGKTAQAIEAVNLCGALRVLVVCPHIAMTNWQREIAQWARRKSSAILSNRHTVDPANWHVINWELLQGDTLLLQAIRAREYDAIIFDECQAIKQHDATRTKNALGKKGIARIAKRVWFLSGSPCPNHIGELFPILYACFPKLLELGGVDLHHYDSFIRHYCNVRINQYGKETIMNGRAAEIIKLRDALKPHMKRRLLAEVLPQLPPLRFSTVHLDPKEGISQLKASPEQRDLLIALQAAAAKLDIEDADDRFLAALGEMESEYMATQRRLYGYSKVPMLTELIDTELYAGLPKMVVFYHHPTVGSRLMDRLQHRANAVRVDGEIPKSWRQPALDRFQQDPATRLLFIGLEVGSTAINLTASTHVLFAEPSWTPMTNVQAARRCARRGQHSPVLARFASLSGSIDELIIAVQARKARALSHLFQQSHEIERATT